MFNTLKLKIENLIATVTLSRPEKKNAMSFEMMDELIAVGERLMVAEGVRVIILTGAGNCFCAGVDLTSLMSLMPRMDEMRKKILTPLKGHASNEFQRPVTIWAEQAVPVIAVIEGVAFGAGAQLALGADFRFASLDAKFSIMEAKWGLIPDMGISQSLPKLIRADQAMDLIMTGRVLDMKEAGEIGLVTRVVHDPMEEALQFAEQIIMKSPDAINGTKKLVHGAWGCGKLGLKLEVELQAKIIGGASQMEMVLAQMEKRVPKFT